MASLDDRLRRLDSEINKIETSLSTTVHSENIELTRKQLSLFQVPPQLASTLWVLQSLFKEAETHLKAKDIASVHPVLYKFNEKLVVFDSDYPNTLLGVDIHRKLVKLQDKACEVAQHIWKSSIEVTPTFIKIDNSENLEFIAKSNHLLREQVINELGTVLYKICSDLSYAKFHVNGNQLNWNSTRPSNIAELVNSVEVFVKFLAEHAPRPLIQATSNRFGSQIITNLTRTAFPKLYPESKTETDGICGLLNRLNNTLKETGWARSSELAQFSANFDTVWCDYRRKMYLAKLRQIYHDVMPVSEDARSQLIKPANDETGNNGDDWDWNDDDDDAGDSETTGSKGKVVELWHLYSNEIEPISPEPFFTLYRAIVPHAYSQNHIWIYADTTMLSHHILPAKSTELEAFAAKHLQEYMISWRDTFDNSILPQLFGEQQSKYVKELMNTVGVIASATNDAGGPDLRQSILGRLVEQTAVFIIRTIEQASDIGDEESKQFATLISKLDTLAVYFTDVNTSVPSWNKLEMLKQVLTSNLLTIEEMYHQHLLLDFTPAELTNLVHSLFVDSPLRRKVTQGFKH